MTFASGKLPKFDGADLKNSMKNMHRYVSALSDYLGTVLQNIDEDNMTESARKRFASVSADELSTSITAGGTTWTFDEEHIYRTVNGEKERVI